MADDQGQEREILKYSLHVSEQGGGIPQRLNDEDPKIPFSAVIVPSADEMASRVRQLEDTNQALKVEQKALKRAILKEQQTP